MRKLLVLLMLFGVVSYGAAQHYSTAVSQTEATLAVKAHGDVGAQTRFSAPRAEIQLDSRALINGQTFTVRVPITNRTSYPIEITYDLVLPGGWQGVVSVTEPSDGQVLQPNATHNYDFVVTVNSLPTAAVGHDGTMQIDFSGKAVPGPVGIQSF